MINSMRDSGSGVQYGRAGSSPASRTIDKSAKALHLQDFRGFIDVARIRLYLSLPVLNNPQRHTHRGGKYHRRNGFRYSVNRYYALNSRRTPRPLRDFLFRRKARGKTGK